MKYSDSDLLDTLQQVANDLGGGFSLREYNAWRRETRQRVPTALTIKKRFGGWNSAKRAAGLETNRSNRDKPPEIGTDTVGYVRIRHYDGESQKVAYIHRLMATLLVDDISELKDKHIHHKNHFRFDNRLENIEVLDPSEHISYHQHTDTAMLALRGETEHIPLETTPQAEGPDSAEVGA